MDALDRLAGSADGLLTRVDGTLGRSGAPGAHPIWPLLRRVGALPGAAVLAVSGLRSAPLEAAAPSLRRLALEYADASAVVAVTRPTDAGRGRARDRIGVLADDGALPAAGAGAGAGWEGAAAEAFTEQWIALSAYVAGVGESLSARLEATAAHADSVAAWMARTRDAVAEALARVLVSAEAVAVVTGGPAADGWIARDAAPAAVRACADIGAAVLAPIARACQQVGDLAEGWTPRLAELPYRPRPF
jgi:hypothetical protein